MINIKITVLFIFINNNFFSKLKSLQKEFGRLKLTSLNIVLYL